MRIEETSFSWAEEKARLAAQAGSIAEFKARQQSAFKAERARWKAEGLNSFIPLELAEASDATLPDGCSGVENPGSGNVWKLLAEPGRRVQAGDRLVIIESMKIEIAVTAAASGVLREFRATPGRTVRVEDA